VREAIAKLQLDGLIETRPGAGSFVVESALERLIEIRPASDLDVAANVSPATLLEARLMLDPYAAELAALRGTGPSLEIEAYMDEMDRAVESRDPAAWIDADRMFHLQICIRTGNAVLTSFGEYVAAAMAEPLWRKMRNDPMHDVGLHRAAAAEHTLIYRAIIERDPVNARYQAETHIKRAQRTMGFLEAETVKSSPAPNDEDQRCAPTLRSSSPSSNTREPCPTPGSHTRCLPSS
jgi:DNA-binding FadR family transcriptional regulator